MTTSPPQPPQNPYSGQPGGYGPPPEQFPQYAQPQQPGQQSQPGPSQGQGYGEQPGQSQQHGQVYGGQPGQQYGQQQQAPYGQQSFQQQAPYGQQSFQQQAPYGQSFPQQGHAPHGQQSMAPQGQQQCRFCGAFPAVDATVRGHQGMIILMRFLKRHGPFCRTCGIASVRDMTAKSLWQGWWGIGSSIVNPITMLANIGPMQKFKRLPEPSQGPGRPMNPGKPLFQRPAILGLLIPIAVVALIIVANLNSTSNADIGQCVQNKGTSSDPNVKVVDCGASEAEYRIVGKLDDTTDDSQCEKFSGSEASYVYQSGSTEYTLCLAPV